MARPPKPWLRKQTKTWCVTINGQFHDLGEDKDADFQRFHKLMANRRVLTPKHVPVILDKYLSWVEEHRSKTLLWYSDYLNSFSKAYPDLIITDDDEKIQTS